MSEPLKLSSKMISRLAAMQFIHNKKLYSHLSDQEIQDDILTYYSDIVGFKKDIENESDDIRITFKLNTQLFNSLIQLFYTHEEKNILSISNHTNISLMPDLILIAIHFAINEYLYIEPQQNAHIIINIYVDIIASLGFSKTEISFTNATIETLLKN